MAKIERFDVLLARIDEDEFIKYFNEYHILSEFTKKFNINNNAYYKLIKYFNLEHTEEEKLIVEKNRLNRIKQTCLDKYGVENVYQLDSVKEKIKQIQEERYGGVGFASEQTAEKIKDTLFKNYNVINPMQSPIIANKIKQTFLNKYGVENPSQIEEVQAKIKSTTFKHYGAEFISKTDYWHQAVNETNNEKYDVPWACMRKEARVKGNNSKINQNFSDLLSNKFSTYNADTDREYNINNLSYDFKYNNYLIELNPTATHNSTFGIYNTEPKSIEYHQNKSIVAKENGFSCIHVWDWDNIDLILDILNNNKKNIYARKCEIKEINDIHEINEFLVENHLQGTCKNQIICIGLYYQNELIQLMTFGKPRYNKNYQYELLRLCTKSGYIVTGGANKLFKYFIREFKPETIISYCDNSKFNGNIYIKLGFKLKSYGSPSKHWYNVQTKQHITDNLLRQRGFDQLFKTNYGKGTSNDELMLNAKFVEIYDCGQSTYIWRNNE